MDILVSISLKMNLHNSKEKASSKLAYFNKIPFLNKGTFFWNNNAEIKLWVTDIGQVYMIISVSHFKRTLKIQSHRKNDI